MNRFNRMIPIAVLAAASGLAPAREAMPGDVATQSTAVKYSRAAAETPEGAQALYRRLHSVTKDVCRADNLSEGVMGKDASSCTAKAMDKAVQDINVPALTAVHMQRSFSREGAVSVLAKR